MSEPIRESNEADVMSIHDDIDLEIAESNYENDDHPIKLTSLDTIDIKDANWLIEGIIPEGDITMLVGDGGVGKGFIWTNVAAAISSGSKSIFDEAYDSDYSQEHKKVILFSSEDSLSIQIKRRMLAAGADLQNVLSIDLSDPQFQNIQFDSGFLADIVKQEKPALMIFDPLQSFIGKVNIAARNEVRSALNPLVSLGAEYKTSFLIVVHTNKKTDASGRNRMADSADLWDIARSVIIAGYTPDPDIRYISHEKSNYGPLYDTVLYSLDDGKTEFVGLTENKDADYIRALKDQKHRRAEQLECAMDQIMQILSHGTKSVQDLDALIIAGGISTSTLRRAKAELLKRNYIKEWSTGVGENHIWYVKSVKEKLYGQE